MSHLIFFLLFVFPILFIFLLPWHKRGMKSANDPPGPRGLPFIGNLLQFDSLNPHLYLHKLSKKYGPIMSMKLGYVQVIVISSARVAKQAFNDHDIAISSRPHFTGQQKISYNGLDIAFAPHNKYWREMRKIVAIHLFSLKQVNSFSAIRLEEVSHMIKDISKKADTNRLVNLSEMLLSLSNNIICRVSFGKSYNEEKSSTKTTFDALLHEAQGVMAGFFVADYIPSLGWVDKLSGMLAQLDKCFKNLDLFYQDLIDEHMSMNRPQSMEGDIIDLLIWLKEEKRTSVDVSWESIKAILMNIFIAGTDTNSAVVTWAMTALMKKPRVMKKVQQEIRCIVGIKKGVVDANDIRKLPYLNAVIKEAMRLYPPVPLLIPRETTKKCSIDGYEIQPKTLVFVNCWAIGRDTEYWENPDEFFPERFLNSTIDYKGKDFGFIPFGSGRRICPGIALGMATVELALTNLLYSFDWKLPDGMTEDNVDTNASPGITMHKKIALCLAAERYM